MMSPRSFLVHNRHSQPPKVTNTSSKQQRHNLSASHSHPQHASGTTTALQSNDRKPVNIQPSTKLAAPSAVLDYRKDAQDVTVSVKPITASNSSPAITTTTMSKRKAAHEPSKGLPSPSPPSTTLSVTNISSRPTTPTSPVQIPSSKTKHSSSRNHAPRQRAQKTSCRPKDVHSPDAIPPSVAALLAVTDIPRPRKGSAQARKAAKDKQSLMLDAVIERQQVSEKELSLTLGKSPMDLLLSPPDELDGGEDMSIMSDSGLGSVFSTRTVSLESMPSLGDSFATEGNSSVETPCSSSLHVRRRRSRAPRRSLEPLSSPHGEAEDHPLSLSEDDMEHLDFSCLSDTCSTSDQRSELSFSDYALPLRPLRSVFKSNLTASLRALRSAAKSISSLNLSSIPPDDFLTRSILTIDPKVPYTDERRPPVLEEEPSAALRRYLNPTSEARMETHPASISPVRSFTASIQMQTYKVQRSRSAPPSPTRLPYPASSPQSTQATPYQPPAQSPNQTAFSYPPGVMRQREIRENSDFIRIAVMEMAMRKRGKLDDQRPGRARWTLPPRRATGRAYSIGADGVPARWVPASYS